MQCAPRPAYCPSMWGSAGGPWALAGFSWCVSQVCPLVRLCRIWFRCSPPDGHVSGFQWAPFSKGPARPCLCPAAVHICMGSCRLCRHQLGPVISCEPTRGRAQWLEPELRARQGGREGGGVGPLQPYGNQGPWAWPWPHSCPQLLPPAGLSHVWPLLSPCAPFSQAVPTGLLGSGCQESSG